MDRPDLRQRKRGTNWENKVKCNATFFIDTHTHKHTNQVQLPDQPAPSAPVSMLVLGPHQSHMAAELSQLLPGCERQAQQEAVAVAEHICSSINNSCSESNIHQSIYFSSESKSSNSSTDVIDNSSGSSHTGTSWPNTHAPTHTMEGAPALLHDLGVWLELHACAAQHAHHNTSSVHSLHSNGSSASHCAVGSADLSAEFTSGLADSCAEVQTELRSLSAHLHAIATELGWTHTAQCLQSGAHALCSADTTTVQHAQHSTSTPCSADTTTSVQCMQHNTASLTSTSTAATAPLPITTTVAAGNSKAAPCPLQLLHHQLLARKGCLKYNARSLLSVVTQRSLLVGAL